MSGIAFLWIAQGQLQEQRKISLRELVPEKVRKDLRDGFSTCGVTLMTVPVIVVFTKFDACDDEAYETLKDEGLSPADAVIQAPMRAMKDFQKNCRNLPIFKSRYPPKAFVILRGKNSGVIV